MNDLDPKLLVLFAKVVRLNGISRAARVLSMPKATISRGLSRLEESLGVRLFERSSRGMRLTEAGERISVHCQRVVDEVEEAKSAIGSAQTVMSGRLRIASPLTFGRSFLSPALPKFLARHPQLRVEVELTNRLVDPTEENFDLVVRLGPLADSSLVAKPLGPVYYAACASPGYLKSRAKIERPEDLARHSAIDFFNGADHHNWSFARDGEQVDVEVIRLLDAN
ncbi:MAG: LysR family transcriptional regulator [Hydrogenophaga sp.]